MRRWEKKTSGPGMVAILMISLLYISGCASTGANNGSRIGTTADLVRMLEDEGVSLFSAGTAGDLEFTTTGQAYNVGRGGTLHVYEYDSAQQASFDAMHAHGRVSSNAGVFHSGRLLAVYFGMNLSVKSALARLMGPQVY